MTPDERKAAHAKFLTMPPTPDREALRKAIEASDTVDAAAAHKLKAEHAVNRAIEVHHAATQRLADLEHARDAAASELGELLARVGLVEAPT